MAALSSAASPSSDALKLGRAVLTATQREPRVRAVTPGDALHEARDVSLSPGALPRSGCLCRAPITNPTTLSLKAE